MDTPEEFYDTLASEYHLLFADWWSAAEWHGAVIADILSTRGKILEGRLLDCTCGIGTQALPLAALGYRETGTDVSHASESTRPSRRRPREGSTWTSGSAMSATSASMSKTTSTSSFPATTHCHTFSPTKTWSRRSRSIRDCLTSKIGLLLASLRDYDTLRLSRPEGTPISVHGEHGLRHGSGQTWQWSMDGEFVDVEPFTFTETAAGSWHARSSATRYRALQRATLERLLRSVGFRTAEWLMPDVSGYYQPIVVATV